MIFQRANEHANFLPTSCDVSVLVVSCDAYQDLWYPFFSCFFKYWPDCPFPVYLGSNNLTYSDSKVRSLPIGIDVDYSSNLIKMLNHIESRWVIFWIDDRVLAAPVDSSRIIRLISDVEEIHAGYCKLISSHPYALIKDKSHELGDVPKGTPYRVCTTVVLWKKDLLQSLLRPGETAWTIERKGTLRSNEYDERFLSLSYSYKNDPPIRDAHLIFKGRLARGSVSFLNSEGLRSHFKKRVPQSYISYFYEKIYIAMKDLLSRLRLGI